MHNVSRNLPRIFSGTDFRQSLRRFSSAILSRRRIEESNYHGKSPNFFPKRNQPRPKGRWKLPYYKFDPLLRYQVRKLQGDSNSFIEVLAELGETTKSQGVSKEFESKLLGQPPSTYEGLPKFGKAALQWQPSPGVPTLNELKKVYEERGEYGLSEAILNGFRVFATLRTLDPEDIAYQKRVADHSRPGDGFPVARAMTRKLHLHVGPTNSGKTYHALQRLKNAQSGTFCGPLRLLAFEVYERFNREGTPCNLITGEDLRMTEGVMLTAATIEMLMYNVELDVVVIDEIQMIADPERGSAWTYALLGCPAKEVHMCGEASVVEIVKSIAATLGETVEVHNYDRLTALVPLDKPLEGYKSIKPGDAVVTFSRSSIFDVKRRIEALTDNKCAVVYGNLPSETRASQARSFNSDESKTKVIVASDAIGMGLNLNIKRVIFQTLEKWDGTKMTKLPIPQVKQIAGRAGRFKARARTVESDPLYPPKDDPGYVTTLVGSDLPYLHEALATPTIQMTQARIKPLTELITQFMRPFRPGVRFSVALQIFESLTKTSSLYNMMTFTKNTAKLDLLRSVKGLSPADVWTLLDAPVKMRNPALVSAWLQMARAIGEGATGDILQMTDIPVDILDGGAPSSHEDLEKFETLHSLIRLYLWLGSRYPGIFTSVVEAYQLREYNEFLIQDALERLVVLRGSAQNSNARRVKLVEVPDSKGRDTSHTFKLPRGNFSPIGQIV